jgi:ATP-dependent Clp protease ATP-binding subunit ClpC
MEDDKMPQNKMERFTQRARRVLSLAQEEAERMQHSYIGTDGSGGVAM